MGSEIYGTLSVRQHDMSLLWDFQPEVGQQNSSYAFFFWLCLSWLILPLSSLGLLGLFRSFYWGWKVVFYVFIFFSEETLSMSYVICLSTSVYHLADTLWSSNWNKQLVVSRLPATFGQPTLQQIIRIRLVFSAWGQTCATQEPSNPSLFEE